MLPVLKSQTGSGKTYTMSGHEEILDRENYQGDENTDGVITRSLVYLFEALHSKPDIQYTLKASYLEVYNEQVTLPAHYETRVAAGTRESYPSAVSTRCPMSPRGDAGGRGGEAGYLSLSTSGLLWIHLCGQCLPCHLYAPAL
jgi:hypothetical protein